MTTYTSQPDDTTGIDTYIYNEAATTNYGDNIGINIGELTLGTNFVARALIKFDMSTIPSDATITSAILSLWFKTDYASTGDTYSVYRVKRAWVEDQATWNNWKSGSAWTTAGCGDTTNDYDSTVHAAADVTDSETVGTEKQFVFDATGLVEIKKMIDGTYTNNGWLIKGAATNGGYAFHSSGSATEGYRPKLVIEYTSGTTAQVIIWG